jgi:hypothetical protein
MRIKTSKEIQKNVPDLDPEISNFSSGLPFFCPVVHLTRFAVAHQEASRGALPFAPVLSQIAMAHLGAPLISYFLVVLARQYPLLYNILQRKEVLVADVMSHNPLNIEFRRSLTEKKWASWLHIVRRLMDIQLSGDQDSFVWNLTPSGVFSVKSMYLDYMNGHTVYLRKYIWKIKAPLKIRIFT